jgi:hypothetical protein
MLFEPYCECGPLKADPHTEVCGSRECGIRKDHASYGEIPAGAYYQNPRSRANAGVPQPLQEATAESLLRVRRSSLLSGGLEETRRKVFQVATPGLPLVIGSG